MSTMKAYRMRLRLRPAQERRLHRHAGALRWVWNRAIERQRERRAAGLKYAGFAEMCKWLVQWRNDPATAWLADGASDAQQQCLKRLHEAYVRFFEAVKQRKAAGGKARLRYGAPRMKRRGDDPGLRSPDTKSIAIDVVNGRVKVPKLGWLRVRASQPIEGELRNVTVTRVAGHWYCSVQTALPDVAPVVGQPPTLGLDMGVANFLAGSDGRLEAPLQALKKQQRRLRYAQRCVSRKVRGSKNRRKAVDRLARVHQRIARQREHWLHQLSTDLVAEHAVIAIEDLRVADMTRSARGTSDAPGRNVGAKAGLNRAILDASWSRFRQMLEYKTQWRGGRVIAVPPAYTSRTCSGCGHEAAENRKTQSVFACVACGHAEHADLNAAKNILAAGHAVWREEQQRLASNACGGDVGPGVTPRRWPTKQEPAEEIAHA